MFVYRKVIRQVGFLFLFFGLLAGCGTPNTVVIKMSQKDFNQQKFLCQDYGLVVNFLPGKLLCSGEFQGEEVFIELIAEVVDGNGRFRITRFTQGGVEIGVQQLTELNAEMEQDLYIFPDEAYTITTIEITEDELIVTSTKK
jgi:hypothetical protein